MIILKKDEEDERRRRARRLGRENTQEYPVTFQSKLRKTVLSLISRGQVGRARRRIMSNGLASMEDPMVKEAMEAKYPERSHTLPSSVFNGDCMDSLPNLGENLLDLEPGVAAGFGGLRNEFLRCLAFHWTFADFKFLEHFGLQYLNGKFPPWFFKVYSSVSMVPFSKSEERDPAKVRPVGIKNTLFRLLHKVVIGANKAAFRDCLEPQQLALAPGGAAKLVNSVRMLLEARSDFVCISLDMKNAHNEVSQKSVIEALEKRPGLKHLSKHAAICLASHQRLESSGVPWGESGQGVTQGDPESGPEFNVAWHDDVVVLDDEVSSVGGMARFGNDDGYVIGPLEVIFAATDKFLRNVAAKHGLDHNVLKTKCYHISGGIPPQAPRNMASAGSLLNGVWFPGFLCYGVAIGSKGFVDHFLGSKIKQLSNEMDKVMEILKDDNQAAWVLLLTSLAHQLDYSLTLQYPRDIIPFASNLDNHIWSIL